MAAGLSADLDRWRREFDELMLRVGARFARVEPRWRMAAFVRGLVAGLPRVNCWSIAEHVGRADREAATPVRALGMDDRFQVQPIDGTSGVTGDCHAPFCGSPVLSEIPLGHPAITK